MTTTDPFIEAARAEAERAFQNGVNRTYNTAMKEARGGFIAGARWARTHLAAQEPTDAEVLAALNADYALRYGPSNRPAASLDPYGDEHVQIMRAALSAARAARRDEGNR